MKRDELIPYLDGTFTGKSVENPEAAADQVIMAAQEMSIALGYYISPMDLIKVLNWEALAPLVSPSIPDPPKR